MVSPSLLKFIYHIPDGFSIFTEVSISHTAENDVGVSGRCDIETSVKMEKPSGM
jgi:hypothetical protein